MGAHPALLRLRKWEAVYAFFRNTAIKTVFIVSPEKRRQKKQLQNADLKGHLNGKRCFIIGNGPSLIKQDLSVLKDEFVFTCNSIAQMQGFEEIGTNVHFWIDPNFFKDDSYISLMKSVNTKDNRPIVFFPVDYEDFVEKYQLDGMLNLRYFAQGITLYEGYNREFDFCKIIPLVTTVVCTEIFLAIYMGAKEIYLLGCDCTGAVSHIKSIEKERIDALEYAYEMTEEEKLLRKRAYEADGNEFFFHLQSICFQHYRNLREYCEKRGIKLVNCSAGGILTELPYKNLEDVLRSDDK